MSHWALEIWVFWWLHTCQLWRIDIRDKEKAKCLLPPECLSMQLGGCGALWAPSLWFLQFFTCVSWGIFPAQILLIMQTTAIGHSIFYFSSFSMFIQSRILKSFVISPLCSFRCSFPLSIYSILLLPSLLSIPCSVFSLCLFTLSSDLPYCFLFKSVILSFLFSY